MLFLLCLVFVLFFIFVFFKQKTAYELRISDWSSAVCSSDLALVWTSWRSQLGDPRAHAIFGRSARHTRVPRLRQAALAGAALLAASAVVVGSLAWLAPHPDRNVLRDHIVPPLDLRAHPSPLTLFRHLSATPAEETLFTVQGLPDGARPRPRLRCRPAPHPRCPPPRMADRAGAALRAGSAVGIGSLAWLAPHPDRNGLRDHIVPPLDLRAHPRPLTLFRHLSATLEEETLFTVQGLPDGARVRLAAMDVYDGDVYSVSESSAAFSHAGETILPGEFSDEQAAIDRVTLSIAKSSGVWLRGGGDLRGVDFPGADRK